MIQQSVRDDMFTDLFINNKVITKDGTNFIDVVLIDAPNST